MYLLYGIPNCDTVKKSRAFLNKKEIEYEFIDFKKASPTKENILNWKKFFKDWPINKRGTTYRKFKDDFENANDNKTIELIINNTSVIKRPILEKKGKVIAMGFDLETYNKLY
jgi:arsenate reductase